MIGCRWCAAPDLDVVLDLGAQPPADLFPLPTDPTPDPTWPLAMACCRRCGLVQLVSDPGTVEEPLGVEPRALVEQAADAVSRLAAAGLVRPGCSVREFGSPHGGSWGPLVHQAGATLGSNPADLVVDVFGLMHESDQAAALEQRLSLLADDGSLLIQFHPLATIVTQRQWNALRHGHMAYYSTRWLVDALASRGFVAVRAWTFALYGGTVLLQARRHGTPDDSVAALLADDDSLGLASAAGLESLGADARETIGELVDWLRAHCDAGRTVYGYGAASRAIPLLVAAGVDATLLPAVADGSPAKAGRCLPGSRIPIVTPADLDRARPDVVLVFVPDLLDEVRRALPGVEANGGSWAISAPQPRLV